MGGEGQAKVHHGGGGWLQTGRPETKKFRFLQSVSETPPPLLSKDVQETPPPLLSKDIRQRCLTDCKTPIFFVSGGGGCCHPKDDVGQGGGVQKLVFARTSLIDDP